MKKIMILLLLSLPFVGYPQVGIGSTTVNTNAILDLKSADGKNGLLMSTVELVSLNAATPFATHIAGMTVYNSATSATDPSNIYPGLYFNDGSSWKPMGMIEDVPSIGDIKQSVLGADANGWYLLNGRLVSTLATSARANAISLGFATNLPNADNAILKAKSGMESIGSVGGTQNFTIGQANLPAITFTGTTVSSGAHTHNFASYGSTTWNTSTGSNPGLRNASTVTRTTESAGLHSHVVSVPTGGSGTAITFRPKHVVVQTYIYLGN